MTRILTVDTETFLSRPGLAAPQGVCLSYCDGGRSGVLHFRFDAEEIHALLLGALQDPGTLLVNHNIAYDVAVICAQFPDLLQWFFHAYRESQVRCTMLREMLCALAEDRFDYDVQFRLKPKFNLGEATMRYLGVDLSAEKKDPMAVRMRYHEMWNVPVDQWEDQWIDYALGDAVLTRDVYLAQSKDRYAIEQYSSKEGWVTNEDEQARAAIALELQSCWGMRTHPERSAALEKNLRAEMDEAAQVLMGADILSPDPTNERTGYKMWKAALCARVAAEFNGRPPLTAKGQELLAEGWSIPDLDWMAYIDNGQSLKDRRKEVSRLNKEMKENQQISLFAYVVTEAAQLERCKDPILRTNASVSSTKTELQNFIPTLRLGGEYPINTYFNPLVSTGRTSSRGPNLQNLPRRSGVRECFVPRDGWTYVAADYDSLEVRAWAQACKDVIGYSSAAERYAEDENWDPHSNFAAHWLKLPYEEVLALKAAEDERILGYRQTSKIPNFGLPGGQGAESLVDFAWKSYRIEMTIERARELKELWKEVYPEAQPWLDNAGQIANGSRTVVQLRSGRQRTGLGYCDAANTYFQGLAADGCKRVMWLVAEECYAIPTSPLFGCRPVAFVHDEFILECPIEQRTAAAHRLVELMIQGMREYIPDVPIVTSPVAMSCWNKKAKTKYDAAGELVIV